MKHQLYIHTPFCKNKCNYCAFFSVCLNPDWNHFETAIIRDLEYWKQELGNIDIETIYFGGGTPTLIPIKTLENIISTIHKLFKTSNCIETSIESNPSSIKIDNLKQIQQLGFNRLSIGIQSLNDKNLQFLGRTHTSITALKFLEEAKKLFNNISCDFIYGLPNQTLKDLDNELNKILSLEIQHLSLYELTIEKNTPLYLKGIKPINSRIGEKMYNLIQTKITPIFPRYEISNYANSEYECQHNKNIWNGSAYIGIGPSAHGRIYNNNTWYETYTPNNIKTWEQSFTNQITQLSNKDRAIENLIVGLRTKYGTELTETLNKILNFEYIKNNPNYFIIKGNTINLTDSGKLILDTILPNLIK